MPLALRNYPVFVFLTLTSRRLLTHYTRLGLVFTGLSRLRQTTEAKHTPCYRNVAQQIQLFLVLDLQAVVIFAEITDIEYVQERHPEAIILTNCTITGKQ